MGDNKCRRKGVGVMNSNILWFSLICVCVFLFCVYYVIYKNYKQIAYYDKWETVYKQAVKNAELNWKNKITKTYMICAVKEKVFVECLSLYGDSSFIVKPNGCISFQSTRPCYKIVGGEKFALFYQMNEELE